MNSEDKQILIKIGVSIVGLVIAFKLFGMIGVIIGLVACYFLFKGAGEVSSSTPKTKQKVKERRQMSEEQFDFLWFMGSLIVAIVLAALFGIFGIIIGLGMVAYSLYDMVGKRNSGAYGYIEEEDTTEKYIKQLEEENKRLKDRK